MIRGLEGVVREDVPAAEFELVEPREGDEIRDLGDALVGPPPEADRPHLGEGAHRDALALAGQEDAGDRRRGHGAHAGQQHAELSLGRTDRFRLFHLVFPAGFDSTAMMQVAHPKTFARACQGRAARDARTLPATPRPSRRQVGPIGPLSQRYELRDRRRRPRLGGGGAAMLRLAPGPDGEAGVGPPFVPGAVVHGDVVATEHPQRVERHGARHPTIAIDDDLPRKGGRRQRRRRGTTRASSLGRQERDRSSHRPAARTGR